MIVDCHSCGATYNIADDKIRGRTVRVRCKTCGAAIIVDGSELSLDDATRELSTAFDEDEATRVFSVSGAHDPDDATRVLSVPGGHDRDDATRVLSAPSMPGRGPPEVDAWLVVDPTDGTQRRLGIEAIVDEVHAGTLTPETFVWTEGMGDWAPLSAVPQLRAAIEAAEPTRVARPGSIPPPSPYGAPARAPSPQVASHGSARAYAAPARPPAPRGPSVPGLPPPARPPPAQPQPAPDRRRAARVADGRSRARADLFGGVERAGGEADLLASSAEASLERYSAPKQTGARSESSVLFSLSALKAGAAPRGAGAPLASTRASPPTAAEILGIPRSTPPPVSLSAQPALLTAPVVEAPVAEARVETRDTTPPARRRQASWPVFLAGGVAIAAVAGLVFLIIGRNRAPERQTEAAAAPSAPASAAQVENERPLPSAATSTPAASGETDVPTEPGTPAAGRPEPPAGPDPPPRPRAEQPPAAPPPKPAAPSSRQERIDTLAAALKPAKDEPAIEKVVLEEEPEDEPASAPAAAADEPAEEPAEKPASRPPFDTGAAKAALGAAAANAASCKEDDGPTGSGKMQVTFAPTGRVSGAQIVSGPFAGTSVGACVSRLFRQASVPAFDGDPVTVAKSFSIR